MPLTEGLDMNINSNAPKFNSYVTLAKLVRSNPIKNREEILEVAETINVSATSYAKLVDRARVAASDARIERLQREVDRARVAMEDASDKWEASFVLIPCPEGGEQWGDGDDELKEAFYRARDEAEIVSEELMRAWNSRAAIGWVAPD